MRASGSNIEIGRTKKILINGGLEMGRLRSNHAVAALGNKIFLFGGDDSAGKAEAYDVDADSWEELAPIPSP